jgi:hypothetical protein
MGLNWCLAVVIYFEFSIHFHIATWDWTHKQTACSYQKLSSERQYWLKIADFLIFCSASYILR